MILSQQPWIWFLFYFSKWSSSAFIGKCHFISPLAVKSCYGLTSLCNFCDFTMHSVSGAVILVWSWFNPFKLPQASRFMYVEHLVEMWDTFQCIFHSWICYSSVDLPLTVPQTVGFPSRLTCLKLYHCSFYPLYLSFLYLFPFSMVLRVSWNSSTFLTRSQNTTPL